MIRLIIFLLIFSSLHISLYAIDTNTVHLFNHAHPPKHSYISDSITKYNFHRSNYVSVGDIISHHTSALHLQIGDPLIYSGISMYNAQPMSNVISLNGVPLQEMVYGQGDLNSISPEAIHHISIYSGMDASVLAGTSGQYIYLQENMYSSPKPFSRIWYIQGGYDLIGTEGVLTQNIDTFTNIHASYRRMSSSGMLRNSAADIWNTRIGLRHKVSNDIQTTLQWIFSNQGAYHNGGIRGEFDTPLNATLYYDNYFDRSYTHTIQTSVTFDRVFNDQSSLLFNAYIGHSELETRGVNPYIIQDSITILSEDSYRGGFNGRLEISDIVSNLSLMSEIGIQYDEISFLNKIHESEARIYGYIYANYALGKTDYLRLGVRGSSEAKDQLNYGLTYTTTLTEGLQLHADYSRTHAILPYQYKILSITANESTELIYLKVAYKRPHFELFMQPFYRLTHQPVFLQVRYDSNSVNQSPSFINALPFSQHESIGLTVNGQLSFGNISIQSMLTYTHQQDLMRISPTLFAKLNAQYQLNIGASTISIGGTLRMSDGTTTLRFIPYLNTFAHDLDNINDALQWNGLDIHATAILGNARIRASVMNVFSQAFMDISGYPIQDNVIRLSLNWSFFD